MARRFAGFGARVTFATFVFAALALAILSRPDKRLIDFDQSFYLTIAYDLDRHHVFSNGVFDDVDSTTAPPPPGMFFSPLYPWLLVGAMKVDPRFAAAVTCTIEANEKQRDLGTCEIYARPIHLLHALLLALGVLAVARAGELIIPDRRVFYGAGLLATLGLAAEAELFSYVMTESLWFSLYSLLMLAFLSGLRTAHTRAFVAAGALLGLLCLARASFLVLAPTLLGVMVVHARWFSAARRRDWVRSAAAFTLAFLVLVVPWVVRNDVVVGKLAFTEEYGSATLVERFAFNDMTAREFAFAFPHCLPTIGPTIVGRLFGADMRRFEWNEPGSFFDAGRARRMALVNTRGRLDPIIGELVSAEMARNWWRHLLTTVPLAWCGLWVSSLWSLFTIPLFAWACVAAVRRSRPLFLFYALPAFVLVGLHAAVANHYSRYNLGLIGPFSIGAAWMMARALLASRRAQKSSADPVPHR
ncbi:MAG: hypothetical protein ACJ8DQ_15705 [Xanthobacteraceae bacterium]